MRSSHTAMKSTPTSLQLEKVLTQQQWSTAAKNKLIKLKYNEQKHLKKHSISLVIREMQIKEISHPLEELRFFKKIDCWW